jgi:hypothetical protein
VGETRVTIQEAARILGVSEGAIRKRVNRDTLRHDKAADGRVYVYLDAGVDTGVDEVLHPDTSALISEMRGRIEDLQEQLEQANKRDRENRRIIAALTSRIPELPSPTPEEPPEASQAATEQPGRVEPQAAVEAAQSPPERPERSWRERVRGLRRRFVG